MKLKFRDGTTIEMQEKHDFLLSALYGSALGRFFLKALTLPAISKCAGRLLSTKASCVLIEPFIKQNHIDMSQFERVKYRSYDDFFSRKIRHNARPVDAEPDHLISPCDSKLTVLPITKEQRFTIKRGLYDVESLLKNKELAAEYSGGYALIFRLTVDDYHRYCYVADGEKEDNVRIPGILHSVNPVANDHFMIYNENAREYSILHTGTFGDVVMMEVGALMIGRIVNFHRKARVRRGQEKGYFQFGGSTIVLLLKEKTVQIDGDILANSAEGVETIVKYGEKIGVRRA